MLLLGIASVVAVLLWAGTVPVAPDIFIPDSIWPYLVLIVLATLGELLYVPVRHGETFEDLTFYEIVLAVAVLVFPPAVALLGGLCGLLIAELLLYRKAIKAAFNIGVYSIATCALVFIYNLLSGDADRLSLRSVGALLIAVGAWELINLLLLARVFQLVEGIPITEQVREQAWLTGLMTLLSVGVAVSLLALVQVNPLFGVFALLPALALIYAFRATRDGAEQRSRADRVANFSRLLTEPGTPAEVLDSATPALRSVFDADVAVLVNRDEFVESFRGDRDDRFARPVGPEGFRPLLSASLASDEVQPIQKSHLPATWLTGYAAAIDLPEVMGGEGVFVLGGFGPPRGIERFLPWSRGGRDQWELKETERSLVSSLVSSLSSAIHARSGLIALRDETAKLTAVVDNATDGIAVIDAARRVLLWSPAMVRITGVTPGTTEADAPSALAILDALGAVTGSTAADSGEAVDTEHDTGGGTQVTITRADGEVRDLDVAVVALDDEAGLAVLTVRDMTRQRRLDRMKQDFIATVSHELKTPITPIKGYAQLLGSNWEKLTPEKRARILATIEERANHLSRLVEDLLMASRASDVDSAKLDVRVQNISLAELVKREVEGQTALAKRISMSGSDAVVVADVDRARQCLANLIGNAGKYSRPDSPIIVEFGPLEGERWAAVDVIDQGSGIPADEQDKVFEKFYRVEDPMTMTTGGNGLGLFISRQLARAMGGDITLESTVGVGSRFRLTLPLEEDQS